MADRAKQNETGNGLRWAATLALAAVGATALTERIRRSNAQRKDQDIASDADLSHGRGTPHGPVGKPSLAAGYEVEDTNVRLLAIIMVVSLAIMGVSTAAVFVMFHHFDQRFQGADLGLTAQQRAPIEPPLPHLQADPYREIDTFAMGQKQRLDTYGWDGPGHQQAHIPIDRAMQQIIGKPMDANVQADVGAANGAPLPAPPVPEAAEPQAKPANSVKGEGRPGAIAPTYDPTKVEAKP